MAVASISLTLVFLVNWLFLQIFPKLLSAALFIPKPTLMSFYTSRDLLNLTFFSTFTVVIKSLLYGEIYRTNKQCYAKANA